MAMPASGTVTSRTLASWFVAALLLSTNSSTGACAQSGDGSEDVAREAMAAAARMELKTICASRLAMRRMLIERAAEEASTDRRPLIARKLAVDSALAPAILLLELSQGRHQEPLALLRFNYRSDPLRLLAPANEIGAAVDVLGLAWTEAVASGTAFSYRSQRAGAVGEDFPALIHWQGWMLGDELSLRAHWYEPFLAQRRLDFPLNPENLKLEFKPQSATVTSVLPTVLTRTEHFQNQSPKLVNPADVYDLFDTLRIGSHVLRHAPDRGTSPTWDSILVTADAPPHQEVMHRIRAATWSRGAGNITRCTIWQPVILLAYETAHRLVGEARVGQGVVGSDEVIPSAELEWFECGLEAEIVFRQLDAAHDRLEVPIDAHDALSLPLSVSLLAEGAPVAHADFGPFLVGPSAARIFERMEAAWPEVVSAVERRDALLLTSPEHLAAGAHPEYGAQEILGETDPLVARWRLRANLVRSVLTRDAIAHDRAIALMTTRLAQDGIGPRWMVMNAQAWIEELAGPLDRQGSATEFAVPAWLALTVQLTPEETIDEMARLIIGGRWGLALLLARSLTSERLPPGGAAWIARVQPLLEGWARGNDTVPARTGPHPDWDARIDQTIIQMIDLIKSGDTP